MTPETATKWARVVVAAERSPLGVAPFAEGCGIKPKTLYYYISALKKEHPEILAAAAATPTDGDDAPSAAGSTLIIALEDYPAHIVVDDETDLGQLRRVLAALGGSHV